MIQFDFCIFCLKWVGEKPTNYSYEWDRGATFNGLGVISYSVTPTGGLIVLLISIVRAHLVSLKKGRIDVTQKGSFQEI